MTPIFSTTRHSSQFYFWLLLVLVTSFHAWALWYSPLDLSPDEAHYWLWSKQLAPAYFSKGPGIAFAIKFGTVLFGDTEFAVRFSSLVLTTLSSILLYCLFTFLYSSLAGLVAFLLFRSMLVVSATGLLATTDPALIFFWIASLGALILTFSGKTYFWIVFFITTGLGVYFKYTIAVLFLTPALLFVFYKELRRLFDLRYIVPGVILFLLLLWPILRWNLDHQWLNFSHNAGHLVGKGKGLSLKYSFELLGAQWGLSGLILFPMILLALWREMRRMTLFENLLFDKREVARKVFFWSAVPILFLCLLVSLYKRVYANWPLPFLLSALFLLVCDFGIKKDLMKLALVRSALSVNVITLAFAFYLFLGGTLPLPGTVLPTKKLAGWEQLAERMSQIVAKESLGEAPLLMADAYGEVSVLSFYMKPRPTVYCVSDGDRRPNQFDIWRGYRESRGQDALIILKDKQVLDSIRDSFQTVESYIRQPTAHIEYQGNVVKEFHIFIGRGFDGSYLGQ